MKGSIFYNISLNVYYLLVVVYGWLDSKLQRIKVYLYIVPAAFAIILAFAGLPFYAPLNFGCWIQPKPYRTTNTLAFLYGIIWIAITTVFSSAGMLIIFLTVYKQSLAGAKWRLGTRTKRKHDISRRVFAQGAFYLLNFYISWPILIVALVTAGSQNYEYWCCVFFLAPIQVRDSTTNRRSTLKI